MRKVALEAVEGTHAAFGEHGGKSQPKPIEVVSHFPF